jgi:hypothetical protein
MDNLRHFPTPWTVQDGDDQCFRVCDASGYFICSVSHWEDFHSRSFQYADNHKGGRRRGG